jgi:hypothetical protein
LTFTSARLISEIVKALKGTRRRKNTDADAQNNESCAHTNLSGRDDISHTVGFRL